MLQPKEIVSFDAAKLFFACLIPLFHISGGDETSYFISQYVSRIGVPFFFAASGYFLSLKLRAKPNEKWPTGIAYMRRIGKLLVIWEALYLPLQIFRATQADGLQLGLMHLGQQIIMQTPSYLWYLTSSLVGGLIFVLLWDKKAALPLAISFYIIGTLLNSYSFTLGSNQLLDSYYRIFLTSRNGVFFGFPLILVGALCQQSQLFTKKRRTLLFFALSLAAYCLEVTLVLTYAPSGSDTSMYFTLPVIIYALFALLAYLNQRHIGQLNKLATRATFWRFSSTVLYVTQYGIIQVCSAALNQFGLYNYWLVWLGVIFLGLAFSRISFHTKLQRLLF